MVTKLFVGNLPYDTQEEELRQLFTNFGGTHSVKVIKDKYTGRSRGFAFVEMMNQEDAERAIQDLNGYRLGERQIVVNAAKNQDPGPPRRDYGGVAASRGRNGGASAYREKDFR